MNNTRLIKTIKTLSQDEFSKFGKFVSIPYFTKGRNLVPFYKELKKFYPDFDSVDLTKELLYKSMNKKSVFDKNANSLMNILSSTMMKLLEKFLILERLEREETQEMIFLNEEYLERGLHKTGIEISEKTLNELMKSGIGEEMFPSLQSLISLKADGYIAIGDTKMINDTYSEKSDFYILQTLNYYFNDLPLRKIFEIGKNLKFEESHLIKALTGFNFEVIFNDLKLREPMYADILEMNYLYYLCYEDLGNLEKVKNFKKKLYEKLDKFTLFEKCNLLNQLRTLYSILYKAEKISLPESNIGQYEAYMKMLETGAYGFRKNEMSPPTYNNIIAIFLALNKYSEAEKFIKDYTSKVPSELQSRFKNMALARMYFKMKDYGKTLELLALLPDMGLGFDKINVMQLKVISLYELQEYETAISQIEALKKYLKENKTVSKEMIERFYGFFSGIRILIDSHLNYHPKQKEKFQKLMQKYPSTIRKEWLLQKIEECVQ